MLCAHIDSKAHRAGPAVILELVAARVIFLGKGRHSHLRLLQLILLLQLPSAWLSVRAGRIAPATVLAITCAPPPSSRLLKKRLSEGTYMTSYRSCEG